MRTTMQTTVLACLLLGATGMAAAEVPEGPDAVNGAFVRLLDHSPAAPAATRASGASAGAEWVTAWVSAAARGDTDPAAAGFTHMLARCHDAPAPLPLAGETDAVATLVRESLRMQATEGVAYAAL